MQTGFAKAFVLPQLLQSLSDDRNRAISWIALGDPIRPGAALVIGAYPMKREGVSAFWPYHPTDRRVARDQVQDHAGAEKIRKPF